VGILAFCKASEVTNLSSQIAATDELLMTLIPIDSKK